MLHEFGANLDVESDNGNRPSHYAAKYGHEAVLRFLYKKVDFHVRSGGGGCLDPERLLGSEQHGMDALSFRSQTRESCYNPPS